MIKNLNVKEAKMLLDENKNIKLIDVREKWEYDLARIEGALFFPMSTLTDTYKNLDPLHEYIIYCHHGVRSLSVCAFLEKNKYSKLYNLKGGIDAWSDLIDKNIPKY